MATVQYTSLLNGTYSENIPVSLAHLQKVLNYFFKTLLCSYVEVCFSPTLPQCKIHKETTLRLAYLAKGC